MHLRIQAPAVAQRRRHGFGRLATLPGERRASTRRVRHNSLAQFLIRHTASLTINRIRSRLIRPDANACMPRAAAQGISQPRPHHRRRSGPRRVRSVQVHHATVGVTAPDSTIRPPPVPGGSLDWVGCPLLRAVVDMAPGLALAAVTLARGMYWRRLADDQWCATLGWRTSTIFEVAESRHEVEVDGDGHGFHASGATPAADGGCALRCPARCLLYEANPARLAAPALIRGVAGARRAAAGPRARSHAGHSCRHLCSQRERIVRDQRAVSSRQLDCRAEPVSAAPGLCDHLLPHRRHGNSRFPPRWPRRLRAGLPDRDVDTHTHGGRDPHGVDERTGARAGATFVGLGWLARCPHTFAGLRTGSGLDIGPPPTRGTLADTALAGLALPGVWIHACVAPGALMLAAGPARTRGVRLPRGIPRLRLRLRRGDVPVCRDYTVHSSPESGLKGPARHGATAVQQASWWERVLTGRTRQAPCRPGRQPR